MVTIVDFRHFSELFIFPKCSMTSCILIGFVYGFLNEILTYFAYLIENFEKSRKKGQQSNCYVCWSVFVCFLCYLLITQSKQAINLYHFGISSNSTMLLWCFLPELYRTCLHKQTNTQLLRKKNNNNFLSHGIEKMNFLLNIYQS